MIRLGGLISQKAFGKFEMGKVISNPFATAFIKEGEGEDHEVSMANNSIDTIIKMATELKAKMGEDEKQIPAWIQDHIAKAENLISQASGNYHEYGDSNESVVNEDNTPYETLMLIRNLEQTNKLLAQDLKTSKRLPNDKKENIKKSIVVNQGLINYYKETYKNLKNNESVNEVIITEDTKRVTILGIDFNISEMNGRIFFSFVDKKAASIKIREIGTNKIVNLIQKSLDNAYGKGEFFFKSGDHAEFQNGYLFQRNATNIKLNKLKFESVNEASPCWKGYKQVGMKDKGGRQVPNCVPNESVVREASGRVPQIFLKTGAVEKKIKELMADRKKAVVPYNTEKDPTKKESLKQILIKLTKQIQGYEKNLIQLRDKEEEYIQQMNADAQLDVSAID